MLKSEKVPMVDANEIRKSIISEKAEKPNFKKKLFGFDEKEVEEYVITLNNLLETTKSSFQSENDQMRTEMFILSKERDNHSKQVAAITEERDRYKEQCDNELDRIKELYDTISGLEQKLVDYEEALKAKANLDELEQKIVDTEELLSAEKAQNVFLTGKNEQLTAELTMVKAESAEQKALFAAMQLSTKRQQASIEGSLFAYGQDMAEKLERMKNHVGAIAAVMTDIGENCQKTERLILDKIR